MTKVLFYKDPVTGREPCRDWLQSLPSAVRAKAIVRFRQLQEGGHTLQRPYVALLRDGIYELRWKVKGVNYRILYFWHGEEMVLLSHGFTKQSSRVPDREIELALRRKRLVES